MVERDDMPGMAADSCSLGNVCVAIGNGWVVHKYLVIMPFADTAGEDCVVVRVGSMCYLLNSVFFVFLLCYQWCVW